MDVARRITHVELLHAPGDRLLAAQVFELLGCTVADSGGHWFTAFVDADLRDWANNVFYASEVPPAQLAIEAAFAGSADDWMNMLRAAPQKSPHFGLRVGTAEELQEIVGRVRSCTNHPELQGRIEVLGMFSHDEPEAIATNMDQAFIWTNVIASGPLRLGQVIEVQWHLEPEPTA
ncbi:hypothetical protein MCETE7_01452 [Acidimicrobiia bacterium]